MKNNEKQIRCKDTGLAIVLILLLATYFTSNTIFLRLGIVVLILSMVLPAFFRPLSIIWFGLADVIGKLVSSIILTVLYITVLTPIGMARRVFGADRLRLQEWKNGTHSVFIKKEYVFKSGDMEKPY